MTTLNVYPLLGTAVPGVGGLGGLPNSGTVAANPDGSLTIDARDLGFALEAGFGAVMPVSVAEGLSAAGTNRATAAPLAAAVNVLATVASGAGCALSNLQPGQWQVVFNGGANTCTVYAPGATTIDGTAGATGGALSAGKRCQYLCVGPGVVISAQLGIVSG